MNALFARLALAASTLIACTPAAQAATCSNVQLLLGNVSGEEIKMTQLQYKKDGNWTTKTGIFGVDGHQKLEDGWGITYTIDFSGIDGESTDLKLKYYNHVGGTKWEGPHYEYHGTFTCRDGMSVNLYVE